MESTFRITFSPDHDLLTTYPEGFLKRTEVSNWVNVAFVPFTAFMLLSFALLPTKWTHRHFLSVCLSLAILCMQIAFIIPLGAKPEQCYNGITPNDMHSDLTCAFTGAFLLFGGWGVIIWSKLLPASPLAYNTNVNPLQAFSGLSLFIYTSAGI